MASSLPPNISAGSLQSIVKSLIYSKQMYEICSEGVIALCKSVSFEGVNPNGLGVYCTKILSSPRQDSRKSHHLLK